MNVNLAHSSLEKARKTHASAVSLYTALEEKAGVGSEQAKTFEAEQVAPASEKAREAERSLLDSPAHTQGQMLRKMAALLEEAMDPDVVAKLKKEAKVFTDPDRDPVVPLCKRWLTVHRKLNEMIDERPKEQRIEPPEIEDTEEELLDLERQIRALTPTTPEGVALMASVQWKSEGPCLMPGTEGWAELMDSPEFVFMRRIRHGAHIIAGLQPEQQRR